MDFFLNDEFFIKICDEVINIILQKLSIWKYKNMEKQFAIFAEPFRTIQVQNTIILNYKMCFPIRALKLIDKVVR